MEIVVNHLTRMHGGHICVAGVDLRTHLHVRSLLGQEHLPFFFLARYGGPFDMARIVDLGAVRPVPDPPHVEDHVFVASRVKARRSASPEEFWTLLDSLARTSLCEIFGNALRAVRRMRYGTDLGQGQVSLGCLRTVHMPELYLAESRGRKLQVRIRFNDGSITVDASVTDLRLYEANHTTPADDVVRAIARRICCSEGVILGVGLTRAFKALANTEAYHYLQVNNIHLKEEPIWLLK